QIEDAGQIVDVDAEEVVPADVLRRVRVGVAFDHVHPGLQVLVRPVGDPGGRIGVGGGGRGRSVLGPTVRGRVVRGGDDDAAGGVTADRAQAPCRDAVVRQTS